MKIQSSLFRITVVALTTAIYPIQAASPSEMLQAGIYNQEAKGDLDAAISIYRQVVAEANSNLVIAAEAQFRLGQCYLKKSQTNEATAALETLIRNYPNEKQLVAKARDLLPGKMVLGPVPWVNGERMQLTISAPSGADIGVCEYR